MTRDSAFTNRTVDRALATAWAEALPDVDALEAVDAMNAHYRESTDWMKPADVLRGVRLIHARKERDERVNRPAIEPRRRTMPDNFAEMTAWFLKHPGATADEYEEAHK